MVYSFLQSSGAFHCLCNPNNNIQHFGEQLLILCAWYCSYDFTHTSIHNIPIFHMEKPRERDVRQLAQGCINHKNFEPRRSGSKALTHTHCTAHQRPGHQDWAGQSNLNTLQGRGQRSRCHLLYSYSPMTPTPNLDPGLHLNRRQTLPISQASDSWHFCWHFGSQATCWHRLG